MTVPLDELGAHSTALDVVAGLDLRGHRAVVTGGAAGIVAPSALASGIS